MATPRVARVDQKVAAILHIEQQAMRASVRRPPEVLTQLFAVDGESGGCPRSVCGSLRENSARRNFRRLSSDYKTPGDSFVPLSMGHRYRLCFGYTFQGRGVGSPCDECQLLTCALPNRSPRRR